MLIERYLEVAERFSHATALQFSTDEGLQAFSYGEVSAAANRIAEFIRSRISERNTPVAILMNYDPYWAMVFFGIYLSESCVVPLDIQLSADEVANLVRHSGAEMVFTDGANQGKLEGSKVAAVDPHKEELFPTPKRGSEEPQIKTSQVAGRRSQVQKQDPPATGQKSESDLRPATFDLRPSSSNPQSATSHRKPLDPMVIIYTSGTTGDPKGVMLSESNFQTEVNALLELVDFGETDHLLSVLPLHHVLALLTGLLTPLYRGAKVTFLSTLERTKVLRALQTLGITVFVCVPQFFYLLHSRVLAEISRKPAILQKIARTLMRINFSLRKHGVNLGKWFFPQIHRPFGERFRFFVAGGSYFEPAVIRDLAAWGFDVVQGYGLTETTGACAATPLADQHWGSVGRPLRGVELKVLNPNKEGQGEIAIRGPVVTPGYYKNEEATRESFQEGWFLSGDLGYRDKQGFYYITGRLKEVIVLASGKNVYPEELERHYSKHPSIKEVAIVPQTGPGGDENLHAIVVPDFEYLKSQKITNSMEVIRFEIEKLATQLPPYKRVAGLQLRSQPLPRTTTKKLKRHELQVQLKKGEATTAEPPKFDNRVIDETYRFMTGLGKKPEAIGAESNLELDLGLDSLQRVELFGHLEEVFGTSISEDQAGEIYTLKDLVSQFDPETAAQPQGRTQGQSWAKLLAQDEPFAEQFLRSRPVSHQVVQFLRLFFRYCFGKPFFKLRLAGAENLPESGPYMICPNHASYLDGLFFVSAFPQAVFDRVFFLGYSEYFNRGIRKKVAQWLHIVPLDPDSYLVRALRAGAMGLRQGRILCIFPEGARSVDGKVKQFKHGASILAREANVPVTPAAIAGTFEVWPRHRKRIQFHPVSIVFGKPMTPQSYPGYEEFTHALQTAVEELFAKACSGLNASQYNDTDAQEHRRQKTAG
ncbi:MAG TPA: AMP-binding protein [Acidobacteriota bacterium]